VAVTAERFNQGLTYQDYKSRLGRGPDQYNRSEQALSSVLTDADVAAFRDRPQYKVLVIVTETCPDVINNLPILVRVGRETGNFDARIFLRDDNKDLMSQFMNGPYESVPVFAFFDADFDLKGVFIERPRSVTTLREDRTRELHAQNPEFGAYGASAADLPEEARDRLRTATQQLREDTSTFYRRETIRELQDLVKAMSEAGAGARPLWVGNLMMPVPA
jgi:hypothetical protein